MNTKSRKRSYSSTRSESPFSNSHDDYVDYDNSSPKSGKWTAEEEQFAQRLIQDFELGLLVDCENGCTLRSYLARKLNCAPMRISKKFAGQCIGKHVFTRKPENDRIEGYYHPPSKYIKITLQERENNLNSEQMVSANFVRRDSQHSEGSTDSNDSLSCTTSEFEETSDSSEAAEWKDVLSFFCGEFNSAEDPSYNYGGDDLLFDFRENWR